MYYNDPLPAGKLEKSLENIYKNYSKASKGRLLQIYIKSIHDREKRVKKPCSIFRN